MLRFELAWRQRHTGPLQSPRRFLDYIVDGQSLYESHGTDRISCLGWFLPAEDELAAQRLLGDAQPDLDGRVAIYVCPEDADLMCGAISAAVTRETGATVWSDLANSFFDHDTDRWVHDTRPFESWPVLRFEAGAYEAAIRSRPPPST